MLEFQRLRFFSLRLSSFAKAGNHLDKLFRILSRRQVSAMAKHGETRVGNCVTQSESFADGNVRILFTPDQQCRLADQAGLARNSVSLPTANGANHGAMRVRCLQQVMASFEFTFVERVSQTPVNVLSSLAQNPARAEKERRSNIAEQRHAGQSQQLLFWLIVTHRADQDKL